jgi:hypothetical protein
MEKVIAARANDDFTLDLEFSDGSRRRFDVKPYFDKGIFGELREMGYFRKFKIAYGTVQWPHEQDFAPETLYEESREIEFIN